MHQHIAFGLQIESAFELPELRDSRGSGGEPDVVVRQSSLQPVSERSDNTAGERRLDINPEYCRLSYDDVGTFRIDGGSRILVDPDTPAVPETKIFRRLLEGQVLGLLCHQRGRLVLHGSVVQVDGKAVVFLGPTGAGKSTTAAAFYRQGYPLLDDDIVVVRFDEQGPVVAPGVPQLKLTPEMENRIDIDSADAEDTRGVTGKTYYRTETETVDPHGVPLSGCYLLRDGPAASVEPVTGHDAILELIANTYTGGLLDETDRAEMNFQQCANIVGDTSVNVLARPQSLAALPDLVEAVVADVTSV
jgi:hypothetical protein